LFGIFLDKSVEIGQFMMYFKKSQNIIANFVYYSSALSAQGFFEEIQIVQVRSAFSTGSTAKNA